MVIFLYDLYIFVLVIYWYKKVFRNICKILRDIIDFFLSVFTLTKDFYTRASIHKMT